MATATAAARSDTPSFSYVCCRCDLIVPSLRNSRFAMRPAEALVRTAERLHAEMAGDPDRREPAIASRHDGVIFLTAAFTGLRRGVLVSLRWRNVDFPRRTIYAIDNVSAGVEARVKDHEGRTVPMATEVAERLARLRPRRRWRLRLRLRGDSRPPA